MERTVALTPDMPPVCRLGLATRGNGALTPVDVEWALSRGINYLNWCGHPDALSRAIADLGAARRKVVVAAQFEARSARDAERELSSMLAELRTDYIDILTLYYVETGNEWEEIVGPGGAWDYLHQQKQTGRLKMIGLTSHQRKLAAGWARSGKLDLLMIRYNAAHRGAEREVFPVAREQNLPVVTFTGLRWKALLAHTPEDPAGFVPASAVDWYRFCLVQPGVAVALTAPGNRAELEENLNLLDDWHAPEPTHLSELRAHGDRVRRYAGTFW